METNHIYISLGIKKIEKYKKLDKTSLNKIIVGNIKVKGKVKEIKIKMDGMKADIKVLGLLEGKVKKKEELETKIIIKETLCETCGKVKGGYYEAVVQLRGDREKIEEA